MAKRSSRESRDADGAAAFRKRQKLTHDAPPIGEDIESVEHLRKLLSFDQDLQRARYGLQSFKKLLDDVIAGNDDSAPKSAILHGYLDAVKPRNPTDDAIFLGDVMEMWSFGSQVHNEGVMSAVPVTLALLLQIVSTNLELIPHGLGICRTLIHERQLSSISKNLSAERNKGFIISPTLRLLREAVCLDGGAYAKSIVRARNSTFTFLGRHLETGLVGDAQEDSKKTAVRTNAVRFFLSCLTFLHADGKRELLTQKDLMSHLTYLIKDDPPFLAAEILKTLKKHILMDDKISRDAKFRAFNTKILMRVLALYNSGGTVDGTEEGESLSDCAHSFLVHVCTSPGAGILYPSTGLYPKESEDDKQSSSWAQRNRNLDEAAESTTYQDSILVYNFALSEFSRKLRPWSYLKHSELLVAIFAAAPELVADYFVNNRSFTFEPKLSMTWIGYAAFLFNTMMIPLPPYLGDRTQYTKRPPPTSILLSHIIPPPITQKVLIKCLTSTSPLTSLFATRLLVQALEKLENALRMFKDASSIHDVLVWSNASRRLVDAFCERIPDMKIIVQSYRGISSEKKMLKVMSSRLLRLYYEVVPKVALAANFDVSPLFTEVLEGIKKDGEASEEAFQAMELENLVRIASFSPGMRWFSRISEKNKGNDYSPFIKLLRLLNGSGTVISSIQLRRVLEGVAVENQVLGKATGLQPLLRSLTMMSGQMELTSMEEVWLFLDNCFCRCAVSPLKYVQLLPEMIDSGTVADLEERDSVSLLSVAFLEQLPFFAKPEKVDQTKDLTNFISIWHDILSLSKEKQDVVTGLQEKSEALFNELGVTRTIKKLEAPELSDIDGNPNDQSEQSQVNGQKSESSYSDSHLEEALHIPIRVADDDSVALLRWSTKPVEDLIEDNWIVRLVQLLKSPTTHIRKEALTNIWKMAAKIKESTYEGKEQVWLLLSELAESSRSVLDTGPAASAFVAFTTHALDIIKNPLHPLYAKTNTFLTRGPVWPIDKLPMAHEIFQGEPSEDDKYYTELSWLLSYLLDSLQTPFDLDVFHKKRWFEKILVLANNPFLRSNLRTRILRIVYRATCMDGGSTTLVTRFGILSWLEIQHANVDVKEDALLYRALIKRVWITSDQKKVEQWTAGGVVELLKRLDIDT